MIFKNKRYLVTGSRSGIGKCIAEMLLQEGAEVLGVSREDEQYEARNGYSIVKSDFSAILGLESQFKQLFIEHDDFDGLICSAGFGHFGALEQFSVKKMQQIMNVNFMSQAVLARLILPKLKKKGSGDIVFIGSEAALQGSKNGAMYCASKFALRGFAQSLRAECAKGGVRISTINPGMVQTSFFESLDFQPGEESANYIEPNDVSDAVKLILAARPDTVFDEINLSPLKKVIRPKK
ncbi:hypothetical protein MNBD_GAMMA16-2039 [hydrothermal vent metagenome]|uniref:Short-chain dehydrogenase n=1 Tax=hydrothermal vent metagenome TaxID=652676 RepID=A0A3B0ZUX3_9ZZZZ